MLNRFYLTEQEFEKRIHTHLQLFPCPRCGLYGRLILHGFLRTKSGIERGHRIFCSNRGHKRGCGKTCSCLQASVLMHKSISAHDFWMFLFSHFQGHTKKYGLSLSILSFSSSTVYRLYRLFLCNLTHIRSFLARDGKPPPAGGTQQPSSHTIMHLAAFAQKEVCPVIQFQNQFQTDFLPFKVQPLPL